MNSDAESYDTWVNPDLDELELDDDLDEQASSTITGPERARRSGATASPAAPHARRNE